jgi:hypothetical protein
MFKYRVICNNKQEAYSVFEMLTEKGYDYPRTIDGFFEAINNHINNHYSIAIGIDGNRRIWWHFFTTNMNHDYFVMNNYIKYHQFIRKRKLERILK